MIYGVGTDVVEVSRIAKALERFGDNFAKKILNHEELLVFKKNKMKENFLAKRFAAKDIYPNSNASDGLDARFVKSRSI